MQIKLEKYVVVKESKIHSKGVFAINNIPQGTRIMEYFGEKITKEEGTKRERASIERAKTDHKIAATYMFELNDEWDLDGNISNNDAKYINHSCEPNCDIEIIGDRIFIHTIKDIKKDEEISFNYGFSADDALEHPCKCGAKECAGYIVDSDEKHKLHKKLNKN